MAPCNCYVYYSLVINKAIFYWPANCYHWRMPIEDFPKELNTEKISHTHVKKLTFNLLVHLSMKSEKVEKYHARVDHFAI
jgi:hypothetical protein